MSGVLIALEDYNVIKGIFGSEWVGLEYFKRFLSSPDFMNYLLNTLKLSAYGLLWGFPVPIILALLLNRIRKVGLRKNIQLLIYAPNFISVIVLCGMVRMFLSPVGPINQVLGINTNWMAMPEAFRTIYIASGIWQGAGWASIMFVPIQKNILALLNSANEFVIAPEPNEVARPATVGACHVRAQWSMLFVPTTERNSFCIWYESSLVLRAQLTPASASGPLSAIICLNLSATRSKASSHEAFLNAPFSFINGEVSLSSE